MKLIIIHGPPAAGKLTVATELARLTGYKLFHNHVTIDCAKTVFEFGTPTFWNIVGKLRFDVIAEAARAGISVIHTFCYEFGVDDEHFAGLISSAEENGGEVHLILLHCDDEERKRRIVDESRARLGKLTDPESIGRPGIKIELSRPFPGRETLLIDTTGTSAENAAEQIIRRYGLQEDS